MTLIGDSRTRADASALGARHADVADCVEALRAELRGPVLTAEDDDFVRASFASDPGVPVTPDVVVEATSEEDIRRCLLAARSAGLPVAVAGTARVGVPPPTRGLLITTGKMRWISVDPDEATATLAAGCRWQDVADAAAPYGLSPVGAATPGAGVIGTIMGGGLGPIGRTFGFCADHVRSLRVVGGDGVAREITAEHEGDLFWALRGGGITVGIVTEATIDLQPLRQIYGGGLYFASSAIPSLVTGYRLWVNSVAAADERLTTSVAIRRMPDHAAVATAIRGRTVGHVRIGFVGSPVDGAAAVAPLLAAVGHPPLLGAASTLPDALIGTIHDEPAGPSAHRSAGLMLCAFDDDAARALLDLAGPASTLPLALVEVRHLGGAYGRPARPPNAVGARTAAFNLWVQGQSLPAATGERARTSAAAVRSVLDRLAPWSSGGTQLGFVGTENTVDERDNAIPPLIRRRLNQIRATAASSLGRW